MPWSSRTSQRSSSLSATAGMIIVLLGLSVFVPALVVNTQDAQTQSVTQTLDERITVTGDTESYAVDIENNQKEANFTVVNKRTGEVRSTGVLAEGQSANLTAYQNGYVNVTLIDVINTDTVAVQYDYPLYLGWPEESHVIVQNTPLIMVLGAVMLLAGILMALMREFL